MSAHWQFGHTLGESPGLFYVSASKEFHFIPSRRVSGRPLTLVRCVTGFSFPFAFFSFGLCCHLSVCSTLCMCSIAPLLTYLKTRVSICL